MPRADASLDRLSGRWTGKTVSGLPGSRRWQTDVVVLSVAGVRAFVLTARRNHGRQTPFSSLSYCVQSHTPLRHNDMFFGHTWPHAPQL